MAYSDEDRYIKGYEKYYSYKKYTSIEQFYEVIECHMFSPYKKNRNNRYIIPKVNKYEVIEDYLASGKVAQGFIKAFVDMYGFDNAYEDFDFQLYDADIIEKDVSDDRYESMATLIIQSHMWNNKLYNDDSFVRDSDTEEDSEEEDSEKEDSEEEDE